jgi:hypothetical protein
MPITIDQVDVEVLPPAASPTSPSPTESALPSLDEIQRLLQLRAERATRIRAH